MLPFISDIYYLKETMVIFLTLKKNLKITANIQLKVEEIIKSLAKPKECGDVSGNTGHPISAGRCLNLF